jgi:hypothetical protein
MVVHPRLLKSALVYSTCISTWRTDNADSRTLSKRAWQPSGASETTYPTAPLLHPRTGRVVARLPARRYRRDALGSEMNSKPGEVSDDSGIVLMRLVCHACYRTQHVCPLLHFVYHRCSLCLGHLYVFCCVLQTCVAIRHGLDLL